MKIKEIMLSDFRFSRKFMDVELGNGFQYELVLFLQTQMHPELRVGYESITDNLFLSHLGEDFLYILNDNEIRVYNKNIKTMTAYNFCDHFLNEIDCDYVVQDIFIEKPKPNKLKDTLASWFRKQHD